MGSLLLLMQPKHPCLSPVFSCYLKPSLPQKIAHSTISRRFGSIAATTLALLAKEATFGGETANGFDFRMTAPDQTVEEAESGIRDHAQALLQVKTLIESEEWGEAQKLLRKSSSYLKQDIYTLIQGKPGTERPLLRQLYSNLFNNVTSVSISSNQNLLSRVEDMS